MGAFFRDAPGLDLGPARAGRDAGDPAAVGSGAVVHEPGTDAPRVLDDVRRDQHEARRQRSESHLELVLGVALGVAGETLAGQLGVTDARRRPLQDARVLLGLEDPELEP